MNIPIYVLNHNNRERKEKMEKRLYNFNTKFIEGVNITNIRDNNIMLSHLECIKDFYYNTKESYAIICEDDVYIHHQLYDMLPRVIDDFKNLNLDILLLSYLLNHHPENYYNKIYESNNFKYYNYDKNLWGAHMYLISRHYAIYLIEKFDINWSINNPDKPFSPDWIITKNGVKALLWPVLGVEEGIVNCDSQNQIEFHKKCKKFLYNSSYADININEIKYDLVIDYETIDLFGTGRYGNSDAGFFCQCSVLFTSIIQYYKTNCKWPNKIDTSKQFEIYKPINKKHKDIFKDIFKINYDILSMNLHANFHPDFHYGNYWQFGDANWKIYSKPISRYFNPSDYVQSIIDKFIKKYNIDFMNTCAIYYRGTDKATEQQLLSFEYIVNRMEVIKKINKNIKFLVQSDQEEFINKIKEKYSDILFIEENITITGNIGIHNTFKDDDNYKILLNFIATIFIMKDCNYVITGSGNCSLWLALLRSNTLGYTKFFQFKNENITPSSIIKSNIPNDLKLKEETASYIENKINFIHIPKNGGHSIKEIGGNLIIYNYHDTDVFNNKIPNQLIIIRNPIERFISSVYFALQQWSHEPQVRYLIDNSIDTPEKWVKIWSDKNNCNYKHLMSEMLNESHYIGKNLHPYKWTYSPQNLWINNPKFIIIMDNFNEEIKYLLEKNSIYKDIPHKNTTRHVDSFLSEKSIEFLRDFYNEDFILYEKYKNMNLDERL